MASAIPSSAAIASDSQVQAAGMATNDTVSAPRVLEVKVDSLSSDKLRSAAQDPATSDLASARKGMNFIARFIERHYENTGLIGAIARLILKVWPALQTKLETIKSLRQGTPADTRSTPLSSPRNAATADSTGTPVAGETSATAPADAAAPAQPKSQEPATSVEASITDQTTRVSVITGSPASNQDVDVAAAAATTVNAMAQEVLTATGTIASAAARVAVEQETGVFVTGVNAPVAALPAVIEQRTVTSLTATGADTDDSETSSSSDSDAASSDEADTGSVLIRSGRNTPVSAAGIVAPTSDDVSALGSAPITVPTEQGSLASPRRAETVVVAAAEDKSNESDASHDSKKVAAASEAPSALPQTSTAKTNQSVTPTSPSKFKQVLKAITPTRRHAAEAAATVAAVAVLAAFRFGVTGSPI